MSSLPQHSDRWDGPRPSARIEAAFAAFPERSPLLVVDLDVVQRRYRAAEVGLPGVTVCYAVKANPAPELLKVLIGAGCSFDVASMGEVRECLRAGASVDSLSYGNTVKKRSEIADAAALGVRRFSFDCEQELDKLIDLAPGSDVYCRIICDGGGAAWPLSRKFGCTPEVAVELLRRAAAGGLGAGVTFHVGSQQTDPSAWDRSLATVAEIRTQLAAEGIELAGVNLGGGLPGPYLDPTPPLDAFFASIQASVARHLGVDFPGELLIEPGRFMVADSGVLRTEVVTVADRSETERWVYLDVGVFSGLVEPMDETIRYPILAESATRFGSDAATCRVVLAGPTCDSADTMYEHRRYHLPVGIREGDRLLLSSAGAYTGAYSTVGFNGFDPLDVEILPLSEQQSE